MGLDGGPLEAEKGLRSAWPGFTPDDPQGILKATRDFYRPENVDIPVAAGANWVYLTWTNGWTKQREAAEQWPAAREYIRQCRKRGIHVSAYISGANMFWEDYLERIPESRKWMDTADPGFIRHYGGSLYRVMANIRLPEWRREIKAAIDSALDSGCEGFWVDNLFWWHGEALFHDFMRDMRTHAARRQSNIVWHTNVNRGIYNWSRAGNVVGTEDGKAAEFVAAGKMPKQSNLGLLSFISGLKEGWRSAIVEHYGNNLSAAVRQLMIGECWLWQTGKTWFPDSYLLPAQWHRREPVAWKILDAMGTYNRHQLRYREYLQKAESLAKIGIVGHAGSSGDTLPEQKLTSAGQGEFVELLDLLARSNIQFEVLFEDRLNPESLRTFSCLVLTDPEHAPSGAVQLLHAHAMAGGAVLVPDEGLPHEAFSARGSPQLLVEELQRRAGAGPIVAEAARSVIWRAVRQPGRVIVHLLNYGMEASAPFPLRYGGAARRAEVLTPELGGPRELKLQTAGKWTSVSVPEFPIHSLVAFYV